MSKKPHILQEMERLAQVIQVPCYWLDLNQKILGVNELARKEMGATSYEEDLFDKTPLDIYPKKFAKAIVSHHQAVIRTGKTFYVEESIQRLRTQEVRHYHAAIAPLRDDAGSIIGTIGTSIDITEKKKEKVLQHLQMIAPLLPINIYWLDLNNRVLGCNDLTVKSAGGSSPSDFIGKTPYEYYPKAIADTIVEHLEEVIKKRTMISYEEWIQDVKTNKEKCFNATIAPLWDDDGNILGTIGAAIEITAEKNEKERLKKAKVLQHLQMIAPLLPINIYWFDLNNRVLGCNDLAAKAAGGSSPNDFIGKTPYEFYPKAIADTIVEHLEEVLKKRTIISYEEWIKDIETNQKKYFNAMIAPLWDDDGNIMGTIGTSIDITAEKEAERLELENAAHKAQLEANEKFAQIANQVAHDIRSPVASLLMIVKSCTHLPEPERIALREAAISISDIANHLLSQYQSSESVSALEGEEPDKILISATLLQLLTDKKYQYENLPIKFDHEFTQRGYFAFVQMPLSDFKRMISNLMNNAVDAYEGQAGRITLKADVVGKCLEIIIQDNGKGMPLSVVNKILQNVAFTHGKADGHGLGLIQVRETLQRNQGKLFIDSRLGEGTCITLKFPCIPSPAWIADSIRLDSQDIVVILDDDVSIHTAWDARFESLFKKTPELQQLQIKHFKEGEEAIDYIESLSALEKEKVFLLTDFELLKQGLDGLDVVARTRVRRSILVSSHYSNTKVRERAIKLGTKILPKLLASEVPITIEDREQKKDNLKLVDLVLVDDDQTFAQNLILFIFSGKTVDYFEDPQLFQEKVSNYPKDIPIYLDNNFASTHLKGLELAKMLHQQGYTRLHLLSGESFQLSEIPSYLTMIRKDDIEALRLNIENK